MTHSERDQLLTLLAPLHDNGKKWLTGLHHAIKIWGALLLVLLVLALFIVWPTLLLADEVLKPYSDQILLVFFGLFGLSFLYAIYASVQKVNLWLAMRPKLEADLNSGQANQQTIQLLAAKRFQEPKHGGLLYFLLTTEQQVLVIYDDDSQRLGLAGKNPFNSEFKPCTQLQLVTAPLSEMVIGRHFSGQPLPSIPTFELSAPADQWPLRDSCCPVDWTALNQQFGDTELEPVSSKNH